MKTRNNTRFFCIFSAPPTCAWVDLMNDSHIFRYFKDFIVGSGYDPKLFLGGNSKNCLFRGYSWIQLIHNLLWHSRKENVRKTNSNNYCKIWKKIVVYQHNIIYTKEADSLFKCSRCRICNNFIYKWSRFHKYLLICKYRMSHIWPKNMY